MLTWNAIPDTKGLCIHSALPVTASVSATQFPASIRAVSMCRKRPPGRRAGLLQGFTVFWILLIMFHSQHKAGEEIDYYLYTFTHTNWNVKLFLPVTSSTNLILFGGFGEGWFSVCDTSYTVRYPFGSTPAENVYNYEINTHSASPTTGYFLHSLVSPSSVAFIFSKKTFLKDALAT